MGLERIPKYHLIPYAWVYQANKSLEDKPYQNSKLITRGLRSAGWELSWHERTKEKDGEEVLVRRHNEAVWYHPDHWVPDPESKPPVDPITEEAEQFLDSIRHGSRVIYDPHEKTEVMDVLVDFASGGRVKHFVHTSVGAARAQYGRIDRALGLGPAAPPVVPDDIPSEMLVPGSAVLAFARKINPEPEHLVNVRAGLKLMGYDVYREGDRAKEVWFHKDHWEPAIGGALGFLPTSEEAEKYQEALPETANTAVERYLPDQSLMVDIMKLIQAAGSVRQPRSSGPSVDAQHSGWGKRNVGRPSPGSPQRPAPDLDDIDAADAERRAKASKAAARGEMPKQGAGAGSVGAHSPGTSRKQAAADRKQSPLAPDVGIQFVDDDDDDSPVPVKRPQPRKPGAGRPKKKETGSGRSAWDALGDEDRSDALKDIPYDEDDD